MVKNTFTKLLHSFLLKNFSTDLLCKFYKSNCNNAASPFNDPVDTILHLWDENSVTSPEYINYLIKYIELLCLQNNIEMHKKLEEFFFCASVTNSLLKKIHNPVLGLLTAQKDFRKHLLPITLSIASSIFQNSKSCLLSTNNSSANDECTFLIKQKCCSDSESSVAINIEYSFAYLAMILPVVFCLPPFFKFKVHVHEQKINDVVWNEDRVDYKNGKLYIDGDLYGFGKDFDDFTEQEKIDSSLQSYLEKPFRAILLIKDYVCPVRKRAVLKKGEVYGAPFSIVTITDQVKHINIGVVEAILHEYSYTNGWDNFEGMQQELIKSLRCPVTIIYDKIMQVVFVNNTFTISGVQAKIFITIIKLYVEEKRNVFEWRDLAAYDDLICDPYSTGLSTRLNRLMDTLKQSDCGCMLKKVTRGKYMLECKKYINYFERENYNAVNS